MRAELEESRVAGNERIATQHEAVIKQNNTILDS